MGNMLSNLRQAFLSATYLGTAAYQAQLHVTDVPPEEGLMLRAALLHADTVIAIS
jgi:hypothetical protein